MAGSKLGLAPQTRVAEPVDRICDNDVLTAGLTMLGWNAETNADDEWLNELTHQIADAIETV